MITMEKRSNRTLIPVIVVFVIIFVIFAISFYYMYGAVTAFIRGEEAFDDAILGMIGLSVSLYATYMLRKRALFQKPLPRIITTVECKKCGFKSLNKFEKGDYVFKSVGNCQNCNEPMLITAIYAEESKK